MSRPAKLERARSKVANFAAEREKFEQQKKLLEEEMAVGKLNMDKIQKGIKKNTISSNLDIVAPSGGPTAIKIDAASSFGAGVASGGDRKRDSERRKADSHLDASDLELPTMTSSNATSNLIQKHDKDSSAPFYKQIMMMYPPGMRVSEWAISEVPSEKNTKIAKEAVKDKESEYDIYHEEDKPKETEKKKIADMGPPIVKSQELYENVRFLGRGAFGDVYLVRNTDDKRLFAMKTVFSEQEQHMVSMIEELNFLRNYRHPFIIDIYDGFIIQQTRILHIVMPYCETGDLGKIIAVTKKNNTSIPESSILRWSTQIGLALHYLHERGAIHRDLKPDNVMLTEGGEMIKLVDFGLATLLKDNVCEAATEAGTPLYTAPEMILGKPYSYPTDCWSFGVMLYELLFLVNPFTSSTIPELVKAILENNITENLAENNTYSTELKILIDLLLKKDPDQRLGIAGFLLDPLIQIKTNSMPQNYRPKALEDRVRRSHKHLLVAQVDYLPHSVNSKTTLPSTLLDRDLTNENYRTVSARIAQDLQLKTNPDKVTNAEDDDKKRVSISRSPSKVLSTNEDVIGGASAAVPDISANSAATISNDVGSENNQAPVKSSELAAESVQLGCNSDSIESPGEYLKIKPVRAASVKINFESSVASVSEDPANTFSSHTSSSCVELQTSDAVSPDAAILIAADSTTSAEARLDTCGSDVSRPSSRAGRELQRAKDADAMYNGGS